MPFFATGILGSKQVNRARLSFSLDGIESDHPIGFLNQVNAVKNGRSKLDGKALSWFQLLKAAHGMNSNPIVAQKKIPQSHD